MKNKEYWKKTFKKYQEIGLNNKPSIFATEVVGFFKDGDSILELGAGLGQDSKYFSENGFVVTCTDGSKDALSFAEKNLNNKRINFKKVDLSKDLPFENKSFDVIYSHLALHYFNKATTKNLFKEIHRVLKPNGIFCSLFNTIEDPEIKDNSFIKIEDNYYIESNGVKKRYFSVKYLKEFTNGLFEDLLADNKGKTYKDEIRCLIRYVGKKNKNLLIFINSYYF